MIRLYEYTPRERVDDDGNITTVTVHRDFQNYLFSHPYDFVWDFPADKVTIHGTDYRISSRQFINDGSGANLTCICMCGGGNAGGGGPTGISRIITDQTLHGEGHNDLPLGAKLSQLAGNRLKILEDGLYVGDCENAPPTDDLLLMAQWDEYECQLVPQEDTQPEPEPETEPGPELEPEENEMTFTYFRPEGMETFPEQSYLIYGTGPATIDYDNGKGEQIIYDNHNNPELAPPPSFGRIYIKHSDYLDNMLYTMKIKAENATGIGLFMLYYLTKINVSKNLNLEFIQVSYSQLTSLDVSKNINLQQLVFDRNQLTELDVSNNPELFEINCGYNKFTSNSLNALFESLHSNEFSHGKEISIAGNPGTDTCDVSIAENKGWTVNKL